jgi:hypothetical protein
VSIFAILSSIAQAKPREEAHEYQCLITPNALE